MPKEKGFTGVLLIVGFLVILVLLVLVMFLGKVAWVQISKLQIVSPPKAQPTPAPPPPITPSPWKTYINNKYNFELAYPAKGITIKETEHQEGECGTYISEKSSGGEERILVDSFFEIKIISWEGTLEDYLRQKGAWDAYNFEQILNTGADEAVEVRGLKQEVSYAVGYPPLRFITRIFKKGEKLFLIQDFHNAEYFGGCLNPKVLDPVKYTNIVNLEWDLKKNFKFLSD